MLEACGSGHYWARQLSKFDHEVRLIHAKRVRPFVRGNKNDAADAQAIWVAAQQPDVRWVPLKSEEQQAVLSLHRVRSQWIKVRTQMVNGLRGLLYEFGVVLPGGRQAGLKAISAARAEIERAVPVLTRVATAHRAACAADPGGGTVGVHGPGRSARRRCARLS